MNSHELAKILLNNPPEDVGVDSVDDHVEVRIYGKGDMRVVDEILDASFP